MEPALHQNGWTDGKISAQYSTRDDCCERHPENSSAMTNPGESTSQTGGSTTVTILETSDGPQQSPLVLRLRGAPQEERPRVRWTDDTVDNEGMGKAKSKCCCIYKKPKKWDESSSDDDSDCETGRCRGHVEKRHPHHDHDGAGPSGGGQMV
ncbi:hypothetical protein QR680_019160 [Steinernema hermaphroditum]|uniref:E3 ubiquitin-protein ligase PPP1R11 n=1 Tax=Steinernema hermaphroditum TaxID=289476 RepID=A0AA39LRF6_9BILA|nr:hypothetical protein QR680_019160 [Steinernema hermaphroditum]